ncbi:alpha/beta hydrolase, partial [Geobacillus sp. MMMUD3]|nr:alpha/beta hydrolase [Geobacillus sp. MMMUD3]
MEPAHRLDLDVAGHPTPVWVHPGRGTGRPVL